MLDNLEWRRRIDILDVWVVPVELVASAVFAAIEFRLSEVDVAFAFGLIRKVAAAFPDFFAPWYGFVRTVANLFSQSVESGSASDDRE